MEFLKSMTSFLPGLYLAALAFDIYWLVISITKLNKKLWSRSFKFAAFMCLFSYVLFMLLGSIKTPSTDADLAVLSYAAPMAYSFIAGIGFLLVWIVALVLGLNKFKKK